MPSTFSPEVVLVRWIDSASEVGTAWNDLKVALRALKNSEYPHDMMCETAGFVLWENDQAIAITLSMTHHECGPYILIPKVAILSKTPLHAEETYD